MKNASCMLTCHAAFIIVIATGAAHAFAAPEQTVVLCEQDGYQVQLKIADEPTLADPYWLRLEIENVAGTHEIVGNLHYRIEYRVNPDEPQASWSGGLCSGSMFQVFGKEKLPYRIARGSVRAVHEPLTNMAGASLVSVSQLSQTGNRMPVKVDATAHFSLNVSHGGNSPGVRMKTPTAGIPFSFAWTAIRENDDSTLRDAVRRWYEDAQAEEDFRRRNRNRHSQDDSAYHAVARRESVITAILTLQELQPNFSDDVLQDIAGLERHFGVTFAAKKILFDRDGNYKPYLEAYAQLIGGWKQVYEMRRTGFWHPDLFDALIDRASSPHDDGNTNSFRVSSMALRVLEDHRSSWGHDPEKVAAFDGARRNYRLKYFFNYYANSLAVILAVAFIVIRWEIWRRKANLEPARPCDSSGHQKPTS